MEQKGCEGQLEFRLRFSVAMHKGVGAFTAALEPPGEG